MTKNTGKRHKKTNAGEKVGDKNNKRILWIISGLQISKIRGNRTGTKPKMPTKWR